MSASQQTEQVGQISNLHALVISFAQIQLISNKFIHLFDLLKNTPGKQVAYYKWAIEGLTEICKNETSDENESLNNSLKQ